MAKKRPPKHAPKVDRTLPRDELAEILGVHSETISRYDREGAPHSVRSRRNYYNEGEYKAWCDANGKTLVQGRPIEGNSPDLEAARLRKENALAAKYEIDVARSRGLLVPADEVRAMGSRAFTTARNRLLGAGATLAAATEGRDSGERQTLIDGYISDVLTQLDSDLRRMGERNATA